MRALLTDRLLLPVHVFVFYRYRALRELHSFPTRRSSDLGSEQIERRAERFLRVYHAELARHFEQVAYVDLRSEEHTSELQSRGHLVCRLLLEKKNRRLRSSVTGHSPPSFNETAVSRRAGV